MPAKGQPQAPATSTARYLGIGRAPRYIMHMPHAALSANWMPLRAMVVDTPAVQGRWLTSA